MKGTASVVVALLLVTAACSSEGDTATASTTTLATTSTTEVAEPTTTSTTEPIPTTTTVPSTTTSAAAPGTTAETVVLVVGDFGSGTDAEYAVAEAMRQAAVSRAATALITTGDNFYSDDVDTIWNEPFGWVDEMGLDVYAAWGDQDIEAPEREQLVSQALAPPGHWYGVRLGAANLLVLDANRPRDGGQKAWMKRQLERFARQPVIAAFHQPAHSCSRHGTTPDLIESWQFLFERFGVDIALGGHDHNYQRIFQGNITYVVTGGGGSDLYELGDCPPGTSEPLVSNDTDHHFLVMTIRGSTIAVEAIAANGRTIDEFSVANRAPRSTRPEGVR